MLVESKKNKKAIRKNPLGRPKVTCTSPSNGGAKIQINTNSAISNLQQLLPKYNSQSSLKGLKTDIRRALGLPEKEGASDYGVFVIEDNGTSKECSIRISNHNANAGNYEGKESDTNISIKMRSRVNKNTFKPHKDIELMEYTYFDYLLMNVEQPIQKIILSIIEYLSNGIYNDKTGVALQNTSPQQVNNDTENNQEIKENRNMNKKQVIRINENQLKRIVMESVKRMLNEGYFLDKDRYDFDYSPQHNKEIDTLSQAGEYDTSAGVLSKEMDEAPGIINDAMRLLSLLIPSKLGVSKSRVSKQIQSAIELLNKNKSMIVNAVLNSMTEFDRNANGALSSHIDKEITKRTL